MIGTPRHEAWSERMKACLAHLDEHTIVFGTNKYVGPGADLGIRKEYENLFREGRRMGWILGSGEL